MSTASQIARARGAAGQGAGVGADDRATRLHAETASCGLGRGNRGRSTVRRDGAEAGASWRIT